MSDFKETSEENEKMNELIDNFTNEHSSFNIKSYEYINLIDDNRNKIIQSMNNYYNELIISANNNISIINNINTRLYVFAIIFIMFYIFFKFIFKDIIFNEYIIFIIAILSSIISEKYILNDYIKCLKNENNKLIHRLNMEKMSIQIQGNTDEDKNIIKKLSDSLIELIDISSNFIPVLGNLKNAVERQIKCNRYFDSIYSFLIKYRILPDEYISKCNKIKSINPNVNDENSIIFFYMGKISEIISIPNTILLLLYYDYIEDAERVKYYNNIIVNNKKGAILSDFLINNNMINKYDFSSKDISLIISKMDNFSLIGLNNLLIEYNKISKYIKDIIIYGIENEVLINESFSLEKLIKQENHKIDFNENNIYNILYNYVIKQILPFEKYSLNAVTKCLLGISSLYNIRILLEESCIKIGFDEQASTLLFIYIRLEEEGNFGTTLKDALSIKEQYVTNQLQTFDNIYKEFIEDLKNGIWIKSTASVIKRKIIEVEERISQIDKTERIFESAKTVFSSFVSEKTLIQILETNDIIAYTISWKPAWSGGGLIDFIESLKPRDGYWLAEYVPYSRIGVVPPNMTYSEFISKFKKKLLEYEYDTIANIIIQRFPTSEFYINHFPIGYEYKSPLRIIQDIIYAHMPFKRIGTFIRYGNIIDRTFFYRPFIEIMNDTIEIFDKKRQSIIMKTVSNYDVTKDICLEFNVDNLVEFKNYINNHLKDDVYTIKRINKILSHAYNNLNINEIEKLSHRFYDKMVAYIYSEPLIS
ncbi:MAG: hypothetical protein ACTSRG_23470 [Candidatus Helarchaeota archaeon]